MAAVADQYFPAADTHLARACSQAGSKRAHVPLRAIHCSLLLRHGERMQSWSSGHKRGTAADTANAKDNRKWRKRVVKVSLMLSYGGNRLVWLIMETMDVFLVSCYTQRVPG